MVAAGEGPNITFELREEFHDDGVGSLRDEIALRHFEFVTLKGAGLGVQMIASPGGEDQKIGGVPFALDAITRLGGGGVHAHDVRALNLAASFFGAGEEHAIEDSAGVDDDGM